MPKTPNPSELSRFFTLSVDMLCIAGFDGYFKILNPAWEKTLGFKIETLLARPFIEFVHPEDRAATLAELRSLSTGADTLSFENRYRCRDGSYKWLLWNATPYAAKALVYATARDITERKQLEQQLLQSQKMEAVGRLVGGVAHDFNNLLTVITGYSELLLYQPLDDMELLRRYIGEINKAGEQATTLARQLLAFSRKQVFQPRVLDLNAVVAKIEKMLQRVIGEDIQLITLPKASLSRVKTDPGQLDQVIMNLVVNARDAMPQGGKLTIETDNVDLDEAYARRHVDVKSGPYVMLAVSDTGIGMDAETQSRAFEPFFTTKSKNRGTGLGLATVYGIVKQSGGHIWIYSEPGHGTTFKIYLPRYERPAQIEEIDTAHPGLPRGSDTILVVEDDEGVRTLVRRGLEMQGYTVLAARYGQEAVRICEEHATPIQLLITDVVMPQMSGPELAASLTSLYPSMRVLYMSGYTNNAIIQHGVLDPQVDFLNKPFTMEALAHKVRQVLDSHD